MRHVQSLHYIADWAAVGIVYVIRHKNAENETLGSNSEEARVHVKELIDRFDEDGEGIKPAKPAEIVKILTELDTDTTEEDAAALFKAADSDGSGVIDFDEFFAAVHDLRHEKFIKTTSFGPWPE